VSLAWRGLRCGSGFRLLLQNLLQLPTQLVHLTLKRVHLLFHDLGFGLSVRRAADAEAGCGDRRDDR
jgi:hypothetical protein